MLHLDAVTKKFGGLVAVDNVSFEVEEGQIVGLIGPNGAGKTTIFNLITGIYPPDAGDITFEKKSVLGMYTHRIVQMGIGRTFQLVKPFNNLTVLENVMVGGLSRSKNVKRVEAESLAILGFLGLADYVDTAASNLTLSNRKRLEIARALATKPKLLLLDEVMAGLNPKEINNAIELVKHIRDQGFTIIMVEHVMKAIMSLADRIIVLHHGEKIADGPPEEITKDRRVVEAYLGEEV